MLLLILFLVLFPLPKKQQQEPVVLQPGVLAAESSPGHPTEVYFGRIGVTTLSDIFDELGVPVYPEDIIQAFPDPSYGIGSRVIVRRAMPVTVIDQDASQTFRTWKATVGDLLQEKGVVLGDKDVITPAPDTSLFDKMEISITRVSETDVEEKEPIAFKTIGKDDPDLEKGKTRIEQKGRRGERTKRYLVRRENGQEVSRTLIENKVTRDPVDEIIVHGTKVVTYGEGIATWYFGVGPFTAAHRTLPFGTRVLVTNTYNGRSVVVTIEDRGPFGGAIIDLSRDAFSQIGNLGTGKIPVRLEQAP